MKRELKEYLFANYDDLKSYVLEIQKFANEDDLEKEKEDDEDLEKEKEDDDDDKETIHMSPKTLSKRLERERKKAEKEAENKFSELLDAKMKAFSEQFFEKQKEKEELSKLSEKERNDRELKNKLAEYERKEKELEEEKKKISRFQKENELIETFREEKLPIDGFTPIAKILSKLDDDDERNDAYLSIVEFLRNGIEQGVKEKFKVKEPESSTKKENKKEGYGSRFAKNYDDGFKTKKSDFSNWGN